jgi:hypothetical protein
MDRLRSLVRSPLGWFMVNLAEYVLVVALWRWLIPDDLPLGIGIAVFIAVIVALTTLNLRLARRLREE